MFKKELIRKLLMSLQMLPVYRVRDGWNNITNNTTIFNTCTELLNKNQAIVMFPEGNHNLARRVRPLSKGFTRIVFDSIEKHPNLDLQIVPVGPKLCQCPSICRQCEPCILESLLMLNPLSKRTDMSQ